jgi:hypothetical protein
MNTMDPGLRMDTELLTCPLKEGSLTFM